MLVTYWPWLSFSGGLTKMSLLNKPLPLKKVFVSIFAGTPEIFAFLSILIISWACASFRIPNRVFMPILFLFVLMFAGTIGMGFYLLGVLIAGWVAFYSISRLVKR